MQGNTGRSMSLCQFLQVQYVSHTGEETDTPYGHMPVLQIFFIGFIKRSKDCVGIIERLENKINKVWSLAQRVVQCTSEMPGTYK